MTFWGPGLCENQDFVLGGPGLCEEQDFNQLEVHHLALKLFQLHHLALKLFQLHHLALKLHLKQAASAPPLRRLQDNYFGLLDPRVPGRLPRLEDCLLVLQNWELILSKIHIGGLIFVFFTLVAANAQYIFTAQMQSKNGDLRCTQYYGENKSMQHAVRWLDALFLAILPAILLIVMNTLIILGIRRSARVQRELTNKANQVAETMRQQRQITIMLVIVCIAFVLLMTPNALFYAANYYWQYEEHTNSHAQYVFTEQLIFFLSDSTHAINFYLYFFSTRRFRKRCLETVFYCCLKRRRTRRFRGSTISGISKTFRLSVTDVTSVPASAVQLNNFSSSSSSSSNHLLVGNGEGRVSKFRGGQREGSL
ncbi:uncharacterized protein LOC131948450 [Physella acuta]|uniref:uncharacterized protein LOC131948450 n=1 Tax=Physella acuta TaxID=109671 RepID=UPI0027DD9321|nr:uncharacterized protein LOC131948450 [Physella acuta]